MLAHTYKNLTYSKPQERR